MRSADGLWTICKIGIGDGEYRYELWKGRNQIVVNLPSADAAIREHTSRLGTSRTSSSSTQEVGGALAASQAGDQ
jgi:hypothetical protein